MDAHGIDISVISLANPWLDFLDPSEAVRKAVGINDDMNATCLQYPGRLFAFGTLPLSASVDEIVGEVGRLRELACIRGVIMGTSGLGRGLDDERLNPVWKALQENNMTIFLHPHYGLPAEVYGPRAAEYGHVLPLALGLTTPSIERSLAIDHLILTPLEIDSRWKQQLPSHVCFFPAFSTATPPSLSSSPIPAAPSHSSPADSKAASPTMRTF